MAYPAGQSLGAKIRSPTSTAECTDMARLSWSGAEVRQRAWARELVLVTTASHER
jgi:hypothetical protein